MHFNSYDKSKWAPLSPKVVLDTVIPLESVKSYPGNNCPLKQL